jgi:hypothetical protein
MILLLVQSSFESLTNRRSQRWLAEAYLEKFGCDVLPEMLERLEEMQNSLSYID